MAAILIQSTTGSVPVILQTTGCTPATGLVSTDVAVSLRKAGGSFALKALDPIVNATASIGSGANGTVNLFIPGIVGNTYSVEVVNPGAGTSPLAVSILANHITVTLAVVAGVPDGSGPNRASVIATAIMAAVPVVTATATGTGLDSLLASEPSEAFSGGLDGDFIELGGGYYEVILDTSDTDTLGQLLVRVTGAGINTSITEAFVSEIAPAPTPSGIVIPRTAIFGYVYGTDGNAVANAAVQATILSQPTIMHPTTEGVVLSTGLVTVKTDSSGYFIVNLVVGALVDISIPAANFRRTFTVPPTSTNLFDIP